MQKNSIVITGGGTGGHLFPAIAMADRFEANGWHTELIGSQNGIESMILGKYHYNYYLLDEYGFVGKSVAKKFKSVVKLILAIFRSIKILKGIKPDALLATGGFVSVAPSVAATIMGIPIFIMEQNSFPGLANRIIGKFARHIFLNFPTSIRFFKGNCSVVGNPIRTDIKGAKKGIKHKDSPITVIILGGSRGAKAINDAAIEMAELIKADHSLNLIIQTGAAQFKEVKDAYKNTTNVKIVDFIKDMGALYSLADLAVTRAGATTISELCYMKLPAIFIPYPFAAGNHQQINAMEIVKIGGAKIIDNKLLSGKMVYKTIKECITQLDKMSENLKNINNPDADVAIFNKIKELLAI